ncbi:MAG TPA: serine hydrolase domain-containing protein [Pyrinomonadaceae bacterium]|nr:serine hydrolase domain-containing protein [Pyrinomonadaceae bacterium]
MREDSISTMLAAAIAAGDFPSAVYGVAERGSVRFADALGHAVKDSEERPATLDTIYDLASLTKPLVTALLCAQLVERGEAGLEDRAARYLPEFDTDDKRVITLRQLLTHTAGLPGWRPLYLLAGGDKGRVLQAIARGPLESAPGTHVVYSDLGYIALGLMLEKLHGLPLAEIARREIFEPLDLKRTFFNPDRAFVTEIAACELGNAYERETCAGQEEVGYAWREALIWGEVHDANAHFLGGAAGHAGLFSTAAETLRIGTQFLAAQTELLKPETCLLFRTDMTPGMEEPRSVGWQLATMQYSTAGASLSPDSFGHLGFTGTSCWNDPTRERTFILLTNRTHARPLPFVNINGTRREFHRLAVEALEADKHQR